MTFARSASIALLATAMLAAAPALASAAIEPGDIVVTNYSGFSNGSVIKIDPETGEQDYVTNFAMSTLDLLSLPQGIVLEDDGNLLVSDVGINAIVRVDPGTGEQSLVSNNSSPGPPTANFSSPADLTLDSSGEILVVNSTSVVSVDPDTGTRALVSSGGEITAGHAIGVEDSGNVLITNIDASDDVVRINPGTGGQGIVSTNVVTPPGQAFDLTLEDDGDILVADINGPPTQLGTIYRIDPSTGAGVAVSDNTINTGTDLFQDPATLTLDSQDRIVVGDYGVNRITRVNPATGQQTLISDSTTDASPILDDPYGILVVPETPDTDGPVTTITKKPPSETKRKRATFRFTADEPNSTFECALKGVDVRPALKSFTPCNSGERKYSDLAKGKKTFRVKATDMAANTGPVAEHKWKIIKG